MTDHTPTLRDLNDAVRRAGALVFDLHQTSPPDALREAADALSDALNLARRLATPLGPAGCETHPDGPEDTNGGGCLICNTHRLRARRPEAPPVARHRPEPPRPANPAYAVASAALARLPDFGTALIDQARAVLGDGAPYEQLVIHAHRATVRATERKPRP